MAEDPAEDAEDRVDQGAVEDLAADPDRVDQGAVKDLAVDPVQAAVGRAAGDPVVEGPAEEAGDRVDQGAVEDLAADLVRAADQEVVVRAAEGQEAGDPVVEDLGEEQVEVPGPEGEPGTVENRASG